MARPVRLRTRQRLTLLAVAILVVGFSVGAFVAYTSLTLSLEAAADESLVEQAGLIEPGLLQEGGRVVYTKGELPSETPNGVAVSAAVASTTRILTETPRQPIGRSVITTIARQAIERNGPVWLSLKDANGVPRRVYAGPLPNLSPLRVALVLSRSLRELQDELNRVLIGLMLLGFATTCGGGALVYWLTGRVLQPVKTIASVARDLSEQDLHRRVDVPVPDDEMGQLVDTFNGMLGRLETSFESLRRFTADASHELRAPLMLMQTEIEVALAKPQPAEEYIRVLRAVHAEVEHLARLSEHLLMLARADAGALRPERQLVDVADFVHEVAARWTSAATRRGARLIVKAPDAGSVMADPRLLRRVLDNLLDNAIRHSPPGGRILLQTARSATGWTFDIADEGPGIPPEQRERLFQRFSRMDEARSPEQRGAGLGLALSAAIAHAHAGDLALVPDTGPGAHFRLTLPDPTPVPEPREGDRRGGSPRKQVRKEVMSYK
jgi:two-component system OmpR family sensor kinase